MSRKTLKIILPLLVLLIGGGATAALISSRQAPQRVDRPARGPLVEVTRVTASDVVLEVTGQGEVSPKTSVELAPQVGGRVTGVHPALESGRRVPAGAVLVEIEARDYELAVERARAAIANSETLLAREEAEAAAAREEWDELHPDEEPPPLVAREPQIREARARLAATRADIATAHLALERTRLTLPFDGLVIEENVDVGDLVSPGQRLAMVYGTAAVEIRVPLADRELAWLDLPDPDSAEPRGPVAVVSAEFAGALHQWQGRVDRLEGRVDQRSRMVTLVVTVEDPFAATEARPPLLAGLFVDVAITGQRLEGVIVIPRHTLHEGDTVWVAADGKLEIRPVEVLRRDRDKAYLGSGLESGETLVTSALDAVANGMEIRFAEAPR